MPKKPKPYSYPSLQRDALRSVERQIAHESKNYTLYGAVSMTADELTEAACKSDKERSDRRAQEIRDARYEEEQMHAKQEAEKREYLELENARRQEEREAQQRAGDQYWFEARQRADRQARAARHERAREVLQRVHINRADEILIKPGNEATASAVFALDVESKADISSIAITVTMPWANVDEATKTLDVLLSTIAHKFDESLVAYVAEGVDR